MVVSAQMNEEAWTVLKLLNWTCERLTRAKIMEARVCAEMLLAKALQCRRLELYTRFDYQPTESERATFRELVKRAANYEPVAYLVGEKEFYSLAFKVTSAVMIPRPETEILAAEAIRHLQSTGGREVWDICTGSGCVACAIASQSQTARVLATDISTDALAIAAENVESLGLSRQVRVRQADMLTPPKEEPGDMLFDVITANPPYVTEGYTITESVKREPAVALFGGGDGLELIRRVAAGAGAPLKPGGILAMEFGLGQADDARDLICETNQFEEPKIIRDHQDIERSLVAKKLA